MLGSTLATVPGVTVDWNDKGRITLPLLSLEGTQSVHTTQLRLYSVFIVVKNQLVTVSGCACITVDNRMFYVALPSLLLPVHVQTLDGGAVPHVGRPGPLRAICECLSHLF